MQEVNVPVLIIGGAGAGLSAAVFLARHGIESWMVERHPTTSPAPKAAWSWLWPAVAPAVSSASASIATQRGPLP